MAVPSPPLPPRPPKSQLRAAALDRRRQFARSLMPQTRAALEGALAEQVLPHLIGGGVVAGYHALIDEISPAPILESLSDKQVVVLPWFAARNSQMLFRTAPATEPGLWGIMQPPPSAAALPPDVMLVPLVAADRLGTRIGYGKGHYDRAIAHLCAGGGKVFTIGLAWELQISDEPLATDPWDMPLDAIATPAEWIDCIGNRGRAGGALRRA